MIHKIRDILHHIATRTDTLTEVNQRDQDGMESLRNPNIPVMQRITCSLHTPVKPGVLISTHFAASVDVATKGPKTLNLAKTSSQELSLVIVDQSIAMLSCIDLIKGIKSLPNHKRSHFYHYTRS